MDNKFAEFNSKKFLILLIAVCLVFLIIIIKAFEYLPDQTASNDRESLQQINRISSGDVSENSENNEDSSVEEAENKPAKKTLNITLPHYNEAPELIEIEAPKGTGSEISDESKEEKKVELTKEEKITKALEAGKKYKAEKQYIAALEEFNSITNLTNDKVIISNSYEEIAKIYAISKRYGSALSFAEKAYNMNPSSEKEMLLARLYYKTGSIDKATRRVNNILQRDFGEDR